MAGQGDKLNERLEQVVKWQDATGDTLRELGRSVQTIPQDVSLLLASFLCIRWTVKDKN